MRIKQNPFSLYDFLGYFVPGSVFLYGLILFYSLLDDTPTFQKLLENYFDFERIELYLPFIIIAYLIGHILSYLSSITVERYSVWKVGYPSKYLLGHDYPKYYDVDDPKLTRIFIRTLFAIFLAPITFIDLIFSGPLHLREIYAKRLDEHLINIICGNVEDLVNKLSIEEYDKEIIDDEDADFFRFVYHFCVEKADAHFPKMQNYVALYGLLRTLTFIAILFFWISITIVLLGIIDQLFAIVLSISTGILSYILFLDFMKFFRRFSLEALMALTSINYSDGHT